MKNSELTIIMGIESVNDGKFNNVIRDGTEVVHISSINGLCVAVPQNGSQSMRPGKLEVYLIAVLTGLLRLICYWAPRTLVFGRLL